MKESVNALKRDECSALPLKKTHLFWKHTSSLSPCICLCCHSLSVLFICRVIGLCEGNVSVSHWLEQVGSALMLVVVCVKPALSKKEGNVCVHVHFCRLGLLYASASLSDAVLILCERPERILSSDGMRYF
ncbi:hypothetical protein QQF64_003742 [Cirrhinus molitorella]|uniref:Uncharacterized protein n=1 Tax=Cirrhinus molitorella TaxID=172907 RepID=A0ABR3MM57_9TELE